MLSKSLIVFFMLISTAGFSQNGIKGTFNWPKYEKVAIPDSLSDESAVYISNVVNVDFSDASKTNVRYFKRIVINSEEAAEEFSKREIILEGDGKIVMLQARRIKKQEVLNLTNEDVIDTYGESTNKYGGGSIRKTQLIYPDLEVGDIIDLAYEVQYDRYLLSQIMRLEDDLVSLYSRITLRNFSLFDLTVYALNGMPEMISKTVGNIRTVTFEKKGVSVITDGLFDTPMPNSPHFIYTLWFPYQELNYETIYTYDAKDYPYNYRKTTSLKKLMIEEGVINEKDERLIKVKKFTEYLKKNFHWKSEGELASMGVQLTNSYFEEGVMNGLLYNRYLLKFMNDCGIPFKKGFTKNLRDGQFIHGTVLLEQLSERFFIIEDERKQIHYLFPPYRKDKYYFLDEIPFDVEGNDCVGLEGARDNYEDEYRMSLPDSEIDFNQHRSIVNIEIESDSCIVSRRDKLLGHYSFLTRSGSNADDWLAELKIISELEVLPPVSVDQFFPYQAIFEQNELKFDLITEIDDSLSWLRLDSLLPGGVFLEEELDVDYGDYVLLPFIKKSDIVFFIKSNTGIVLEESSSDFHFDNKVGSINMTLTSVNVNLIKVVFKVSVKQKYLFGDAVQEYESFIRNYADIISKKWVVKLGKPSN